MELDDHDPELGEQTRRSREQRLVLGAFDVHLQKELRRVAAELRCMPVIERDVALVGHAAHEPFVEHEARMVCGGAVDGVISEEHLHAAAGKLGLEARLRRDARRKRVAMPSRSSGRR